MVGVRGWCCHEVGSVGRDGGGQRGQRGRGGEGQGVAVVGVKG